MLITTRAGLKKFFFKFYLIEIVFVAESDDKIFCKTAWGFIPGRLMILC